MACGPVGCIIGVIVMLIVMLAAAVVRAVDRLFGPAAEERHLVAGATVGGGAPGGEGRDLSSVARFIRDNILGKSCETPLYRYDQLCGDYAYASGLDLVKNSCHMGQRKLLLGEIQFYTQFVRGERPLVIYAGGASGEHTPMILKMFPKIRLLLIDPNYHNIDAKTKYVYQNVERISRGNLHTFKQYAEYDGSRSRPRHLKRGAVRLKHMQYMHSGVIDAIASADPASPDHKTNSARASAGMADFYAKHYKTLVDDIAGDTDTRVFIIQDYMTAGLAELIGESAARAGASPALYFVSDVRTVAFDYHPTDLDYLWNYALQTACVKILRPAFSMLKFHPPYFLPGDTSVADLDNPVADAKEGPAREEIKWAPAREAARADIELVRARYGFDMLADYRAGEFKYFRPEVIFNQAWGPVGSSEARMIVSAAGADADLVPYSHREWENRYYHLRLDRMYAYYPVFYDLIRTHPKNEYDACGDCCLEMLILGCYLLRRGAETGAESEPSGTMDHEAVRRRMGDPTFLADLVVLYKGINAAVYYGLKDSSKCPLHGHLVSAPSAINVYTTDGRAGGSMAFTRLTVRADSTAKQQFTVGLVGGKIVTSGKANFDLSPENRGSARPGVLRDVLRKI